MNKEYFASRDSRVSFTLEASPLPTCVRILVPLIILLREGTVSFSRNIYLTVLIYI